MEMGGTGCSSPKSRAWRPAADGNNWCNHTEANIFILIANKIRDCDHPDIGIVILSMYEAQRQSLLAYAESHHMTEIEIN